MSSDADLDALLRRVPEPSPPAEVRDDELVALRSGRLPADQVARLEAAVASDPEARGLLVALAEPVSAELRGQALAALPRRPVWWSIQWVVPLAATAAAIFWVTRPRVGLDHALLEAELLAVWGEGAAVGSDQVSALAGPTYTVEGPFGGQQLVRSEQVSTVFGPESRFKLVLRPEGPGAEALRVFVDGRPVEVTTERGDGGVFRMQALGAALFEGPAGPRTVQVVLGSRAAVEAASRSETGPGLTLIERVVEWRPEGTSP